MNPQRLLDGFSWPEFRWRRGELLSQFQGKLVLLGVDDMDVFKVSTVGIAQRPAGYEHMGCCLAVYGALAGRNCCMCLEGCLAVASQPVAE